MAMTELEAARAASLLLRNGGKLVHHMPSDLEWADRGSFFCDWCGMIVPMTDMLSGGGACLWDDEKRENGVPEPAWVYGYLQCWKVFEDFSGREESPKEARR